MFIVSSSYLNSEGRVKSTTIDLMTPGSKTEDTSNSTWTLDPNKPKSWMACQFIFKLPPSPHVKMTLATESGRHDETIGCGIFSENGLCFVFPLVMTWFVVMSWTTEWLDNVDDSVKTIVKQSLRL